MRKALIVAAVLTLAGCETPPDPQKVYNDRLMYCAQIGFAPGTPESGDCMLRLQAMDEQYRATMGAAIIGSGMLNPRRSFNCYTVAGYTSCY